MAESPLFNDEVADLAQLLAAASSAVVLTGAGISTESGIPDFRSPGGIWSRMKPITYDEFVASETARLEDWRRRFKMNADFAAASPNAGHRVIADLVRRGRIGAVITQNIDGLHQRGGTPEEAIVEIHGNATHGHCLACRAPMSLGAVRRIIDATGASPRCGCGGVVKAAIVSFGEKLPEPVLARAVRLASECDLFLVVGSSLAVRPASSLPAIAARGGAAVVVVNRDPTPVDASARLVVRSNIGEVFGALAGNLAETSGGDFVDEA